MNNCLRFLGCWSLAASCVFLSGCGGSDHDELQTWITEQRNLAKPRVQPIPEPKKFTPENYAQDGAFDPFSSQKLTQALKKDTPQSPSNTLLLAPELARRKEALESFPLDGMVMVGSLVKQGQPVALVKVQDLLYTVRPGNYLGQNFGKVTKIGEGEVVLREIVQDAAGEWIERSAKLQLQEGSK